MQSSRKDLLIASGLIVGGVAAFFLFLYLTGHDPDERPLAWYEWMIGGALIAPGFGRLFQWSNRPDRRIPWGPRATHSGATVDNGSPPEMDTITTDPDAPAIRQTGAPPADADPRIRAPD